MRSIKTCARTLLTSVMLALPAAQAADAPASAPRLKLGAYYFAGWSGKSPYDDGSVSNAWAKGMPTHFTRKLGTDFAGRTPVWGWREDAPGITERQIDLAADHGLAFFAYCWYFKDSKGPINVEKIEQHPLHEPMKKFMSARNNTRMEFCLLVANHKGSEITGSEAWKQAADYWLKHYFGHPRYLRMDGKPLVIIFSPKGSDKAGLAYLQEAARKAGFPGVWVAGCGNVKAEDGYQLATAYNTRPVKDAEGKAFDLETSYPFKLLADWNVAAWSGTSQTALPRIPLSRKAGTAARGRRRSKTAGEGLPPRRISRAARPRSSKRISGGCLSGWTPTRNGQPLTA